MWMRRRYKKLMYAHQTITGPVISYQQIYGLKSRNLLPSNETQCIVARTIS